VARRLDLDNFQRLHVVVVVVDVGVAGYGFLDDVEVLFVVGLVGHGGGGGRVDGRVGSVGGVEGGREGGRRASGSEFEDVEKVRFGSLMVGEIVDSGKCWLTSGRSDGCAWDCACSCRSVSEDLCLRA
jgi:hypothetical protein